MVWFELDENNLVNLDRINYLEICELTGKSPNRFCIKLYHSDGEIYTESMKKEECHAIYQKIKDAVSSPPPYFMENVKLSRQFQEKTLRLMEISNDIANST